MRETVSFLGHTLPRHLLVYGDKVKMALYQSSCEINMGRMVFSLALAYIGSSKYEDVNIPADVLEEANQIIVSVFLFL